MKSFRPGYILPFVWVYAMVVLPFLLWAQQKDSMLMFQQDEILFVKTSLVNRLPVSSVTDTFLDTEKFLPNFDVAFQKLPGVLSTNNENTAQDLRINIRGYGSRAAFGIRGVKMLLDGIPLTSPDGTSQIDELSMFMLYKTSLATTNLSSSLGNGGGGTLQLSSLPFEKGGSINIKLNSYKGYDIGSQVGLAKGIGKYQLLVNHHRTQSLRNHAAGKNTILYNKNRWDFSSKWSLENMLHGYLSPQGQDPGALTEVQFAENPLSANPTNLIYNAGEEVNGFTFGLKSLFTPDGTKSWRSIAFIKNRRFTGRLPFKNGGITTFNRLFSGWSNDVIWSVSKGSTFTLGAGWLWQQDRRKRFENNNGKQGLQDTDQWERANNFYLSQQWNLDWKKWTFMQAFRVDYFLFSLEDIFPENGIQDGQKIFRQGNGSLGVQFQPRKNWKTFVNVNTGFETPTLQELSVNPDNSTGFNQQLQPEKSIQVEWGQELKILRRVLIQSSLYFIHLKNVISGYEVDLFPGRVFYRNYLTGRRIGGVISCKYQISKSHQLHTSYEYTDYQYSEDTGSGAAIHFFQPLIPKHRWTIQYYGSWREIVDFSVYAQWYSALYLTDSNLVKSPDQWGLQTMLHTGSKVSEVWTAGIHFNNLFDVTRYSNFRLNAAGGRYYETASPFGISVFMQWRFWK